MEQSLSRGPAGRQAGDRRSGSGFWVGQASGCVGLAKPRPFLDLNFLIWRAVSLEESTSKLF